MKSFSCTLSNGGIVLVQSEPGKLLIRAVVAGQTGEYDLVDASMQRDLRRCVAHSVLPTINKPTSHKAPPKAKASSG